MVLVDTSVLVDKLRKNDNEKTRKLDKYHKTGTEFGISIFTFHEILQGAKTDMEFQKLYEYFSTQKILTLPNTAKVFAASANMYVKLRQEGTTIRNTIDVLIAYTAIYHDIPLLHNDSDFEYIAEKFPELKIT